MMMASSSSSTISGSNGQRTPNLARHNSSFLGAIKHIVTAPLGWFGSADERADIAGSKRRRPESRSTHMAAYDVEDAPTEIVVEEQRSSSSEYDQEEASRRSKRMRINGSGTVNLKTDSVSTMRRSSVVPRASSAVLPSSRSASRATLSPKRNTKLYPFTIQRTMSIDPTQLAPRHDTSSAFNFGVDVDMVSLDPPDMSMPPTSSRLSPRPSFRMRSSMTPQPVHTVLPQRHISEPPPLNALFSNPVFVHPPVEEEATPTPDPVPTLGTLLESSRNARLPMKHQHVSLLFSKSSEDDTQKDAPAERALQQLDIYKTPLLPSRMRSDADSITASVIPDMFKRRRASRPVLMDRKGSNVKNRTPKVNETKPYAGEGGMKKLLARAKLEAEKEKAKENAMEGDIIVDTIEKVPPLEVSLSQPPPPVSYDWFKTAVSGTSTAPSASSLRVGRQKTSRHHFQRPSKSRFSAVYEDDGDEVVQDDERATERRILEEAAKKVPSFNIPPSFSFAKDTPAPLPNADQLQNAKEPPIPMLPFSLSKPSVPSELAKSGLVSQSEPALSLPELKSKGTSIPTPLFSLEKSASTTVGTTVPDFFATSRLPKNDSAPLLPPMLDFKAPTDPKLVATGLFGTASASTDLAKPQTDANLDQFMEGRDKEAMKPSTFGSNALPSGPHIPEHRTLTVHSSVFSPVSSTLTKPSEHLMSQSESTPDGSFQKSLETQPLPLPSLFSFGKAEEKSSGGASSLPFAFEKHVEKPSATSGLPFSLVASGGAKSESGPKPLFEPSTTVAFSSATRNVPNLLFGEPAKAATPFTTVPPPHSTPSPLPFTFGGNSGSSATSTDPPVSSTEKSRPTFPFVTSADVSANSAPSSTTVMESSPFSFGATSSATPAKPEVKPLASFSFGSPSSSSVPPATTPPLAFSFGPGKHTGTGGTTKSSFMFGVAPKATLSPPERPITPPNTYQEVRMEESPIREMQVNGKTSDISHLNSSFSFGGPTMNGIDGNTVNGSTATSTTPFTFGVPATASNPFTTKKDNKPFGGFGTPQAPPINTSFSFGKDESRPASAFAFGQTPTSTTNLTPAFTFGATTNTSPNPFAAINTSAPSSPSTFTQQAAFTFGAAPAPTTTNFGFGSQPSSPASGPDMSLPQATTAFGSAFSQTPSPASPFSALPLAPSTSTGTTLFTIGAPPSGQRQIKKLPRRGNVKR